VQKKNVQALDLRHGVLCVQGISLEGYATDDLLTLSVCCVQLWSEALYTRPCGEHATPVASCGCCCEVSLVEGIVVVLRNCHCFVFVEGIVLHLQIL
jgi:hypothetical protein